MNTRKIYNSKVGVKLLRVYKKLMLPYYKGMAHFSRKFAAHEHKMLFFTEWCVDNPEQFDHNIDLYWQWGSSGKAHWVERGVYNLLALQMFKNPIVVELCCGEGFNSKYFYSYAAKRIYACDFDPIAIKEAKKKNNKSNIKFDVMDIRDGIPDKVAGQAVTNIIWDTAIEHFTEEEIDSIMNNIHSVLETEKGILSGHTIQERPDGKTLKQHEYEFKNKEDLERFFTPYFKNVIVFETEYEDRHNLYFWASDGDLPFSNNWKHIASTIK